MGFAMATEEALPPSKEEKDMKIRSNKKVKTGTDPPDMLDRSGHSGAYEGRNDRTSPARRKVSFKDTVMGEGGTDATDRGHHSYSAGGNENGNPAQSPGETDGRGLFEDISDDEFDIEDDNEDCPNISLGPYEKRRLRSKWSNALIVKLLGHTVGYNFLVRKLRSLWHIQSGFDVIDVGHDVYVVRFASKKEYEHALFYGPWVIADHYLAVSRWPDS